jgi:hypothetical protein
MAWSTLVALYVLAGIAMLAFIKLVCHITLKDAAVSSFDSGAAAAAAAVSSHTSSAGDSLPQVATARQPTNFAAHVGNQQHVLASEVLKPLILYMQYMLIISTLNIEWQVIWPFFKALGWLWAPTNSTTLSIECLLPSSSSVQLPVQKLLLSLSMPLLVLLVLLALHGLHVVYKHCISKARYNDVDVSNIGVQLSQLSFLL